MCVCFNTFKSQWWESRWVDALSLDLFHWYASRILCKIAFLIPCNACLSLTRVECVFDHAHLSLALSLSYTCTHRPVHTGQWLQWLRHSYLSNNKQHTEMNFTFNQNISASIMKHYITPACSSQSSQSMAYSSYAFSSWLTYLTEGLTVLWLVQQN